MNNRGFLLAETTLKIIIAVISLGFLIFLLTSLYLSNIEAEKREQAKGVLNGEDGLIASLNELSLEDEPKSFPLLQPVGWELYTFTGNGLKPQACGGNNCLCICDDVTNLFGSDREEWIEECDDAGVCVEVADLRNYPEDGEREIAIRQGTEINLAVTLSLKRSSEGIDISEI